MFNLEYIINFLLHSTVKVKDFKQSFVIARERLNIFKFLNVYPIKSLNFNQFLFLPRKCYYSTGEKWPTLARMKYPSIDPREDVAKSFHVTTCLDLCAITCTPSVHCDHTDLVRGKLFHKHWCTHCFVPTYPYLDFLFCESILCRYI